MKKNTRLCSCGTPLIFTFAFPYKEWYCLNCGESSEFFNGAKEEQSNREIQLKEDLVNVIFKRIKKDFMPRGCQIGTCKKCEMNGGPDRYHHLHLTKGEKEKDILARKYLEKFVGIFE